MDEIVRRVWFRDILPTAWQEHYLSRPVEGEKVRIVLNVGLEPCLELVSSYLKTGETQGDTAVERRHIKMKANNYLLYDGEMYRRTTHGLRFVPKIEDRMKIIKGLHDELSCKFFFFFVFRFRK